MDKKLKRYKEQNTLLRSVIRMLARQVIVSQDKEHYCPVCGATLPKNHKLLK